MVRTILGMLGEYRFEGNPALAILGMVLLIAIFVVIACITKNGPPEPPRCDPWSAYLRRTKKDGN